MFLLIVFLYFITIFLIRLFRKLFLLIERVDFSPKKYLINVYNPRSLAMSGSYRDAVATVVITLVTLVLGAVAGAVASSVYSSPVEGVFESTSSALQWFWSKTISSGGGWFIILLCVLILEVIGLSTYMRFKSNKRNESMLDEIYSSFQVGELTPENLGSEYRHQLLRVLPEIRKRHPVLKVYNKADVLDFKLFTLDKIKTYFYINLCGVLLVLLAGIVDIFLSLIDNEIRSICLSIFGLILHSFLSFYYLKNFHKWERRVIDKRREGIWDSVKIVCEKYIYIIYAL